MNTPQLTDTPDTQAPSPAPALTLEPAEIDELVRATAPDATVRMASAALGIAAAVVGGTGIQLLILKPLIWHLKLLPWAMLLGTVVFTFLCAKIYRKRAWAPIAVAISATLMLGVTGYWTYFSLTHGLISYFAIIAPLACAVALGIGMYAYPACQAAAEAKVKLREGGLDVDFF